MEMSIGIDLGTTNTVVAIGRRGVHGYIEVETEKITQIGDDRITPVTDELLPSVLYVEEGIPYVGQVARAMKSQNRKRVISNSKNYIGLRDYKWTIDDREYSPEIVESHFLKAARIFLEGKYINKDILKSAVITVPASFDIDQKRATKTAAKLAGFEESKIILISEPTAAILDFINEQRKYKDESKVVDFSQGKKVLVFDLGGGTCDVAVLGIKIQGDNVNVEELAVSPHTLIGGSNFDACAVLGIINEYNKLHNVNLEDILGEQGLRDLKYELTIRCEKAKLFFSGRYENFKNLSPEDRTRAVENLKFPISVPNGIKDKAFLYELTMNKYNNLIEPLISHVIKNGDNIIEPIVKTLQSAGITIEGIDEVFCVGGMTMYPAVFDALRSFFKREPMSVLNKMTAVSRGAAVFHYYKVNLLTKGEMSIDVIPAMPQSVFLNVTNGLPLTLIEAGTKAGTPKQYDNLLKVNSELGLELELYGGRSVFDPDLKKLRNVKLIFPRGIERGTSISLKVEYTDVGVLNFEAWLTDHKEIKIEVCLDELLTTPKQIEELRKDINLERIQGVY